MKNHIKEITIFIIQVLMFYIFPIFAINYDPMGMVFMIIISTFILSILMGIFFKNKIKYFYPIIIAVIFIPSVFIYYNESAFVHSIWYLIDSGIGLLIGNTISNLIGGSKSNNLKNRV